MGVKVAIAGVGNCASAFVQGLEYYSGRETRGLWHPRVAGLKPSDIEVVAAFDIDSRKVGVPLSEAIFVHPNVTKRYVADPVSPVRVSAGLGAEVPPHLKGAKLTRVERRAVSRRLAQSGAKVLVNLISSGSSHSSEEYALAALDAGCALVNCTPALTLRNKALARGFSEARLPLVGDDLMSQFGGTVFHKGLLGLMVHRGVKIQKSYQLDVGGGSETLNTIDESIRAAKRTVKTASVAAEVPYKFQTISGTTDYVDYMGNDRTSYFWFEGAGFMDSGISVDVYLRSSDGANAGNVLLDVVRATHACLGRSGLAGVADICAYGFKSPVKPEGFEAAYSRFSERFAPN